MSNFAQRLDAALHHAGYIDSKGRILPNDELGGLFGVTGAMVWRWRKPGANCYPRMNKAVEVARVLGVNLDWLLTGRGHMATGDPVTGQFFAIFETLPEEQQNEIMSYTAYILDRMGDKAQRDSLRSAVRGDSSDKPHTRRKEESR